MMIYIYIYYHYDDYYLQVNLQSRHFPNRYDRNFHWDPRTVGYALVSGQSICKDTQHILIYAITL